MCLKQLFKRERKGTVGKIVKTTYADRVLGSSLTLFSLEREDGRIERIAMTGYHLEPTTGDRVEVFLGRIIAERNEVHYEKQSNGNMKKIEDLLFWYEIKEYKILKDNLPDK